MKKFSHYTQISRGFSLIELLIALAIIGILSSIAYPSYTRHVQKANRSDAQTVLLGMLSKQQNFFGRNMTYTIALKADLNYNTDPFITDNGLYSIAASTCAAPFSTAIGDCVLLTATALGSQVTDGNLTINSAGEKKRGGKPGW